MTKLPSLAFACAAFAFSLACASTPPAPPAPDASGGTAAAPPAAEGSAGAAPASAGGAKSLYERLGGKPAIEAVVDEMLANVAGDTRINHRFALTDLKDLRQKLVDQVCQATGGPCVYKGGDMKTVHRGMRVSNADFTAVAEALVKALDKFKVPEREKGELLGAVGSLQKDIVEVP